jgi:hypothetical protein
MRDGRSEADQEVNGVRFYSLYVVVWLLRCGALGAMAHNPYQPANVRYVRCL